MQENVYQTHIANIDELKHRLVVRCGRSWTKDISLQLSDSGDAVSMRVTVVWKLRGILWPTFALNLHVAL